jgi:hypothetical protein
MAAPLNTCTTIEQRGVVRFSLAKKYGCSKEYPQRNAAHMGSSSLWAKNMDAAKDIHKEMLPIWAAFLCGYSLLHPYFLRTKNAQHHAVLSWYMYSGALPSCNSCYVCTTVRIPILCVTIKLDSAAI